MDFETALNSCIFRYVSGSHAYGTERPDSDRDYRGVFIAPMVSSFQVFVGEDENGLPNGGVQTVHHPKRDEEMHELRKFLKLAADANPNLLEYLYADRLIAITTPMWEKIRSHRDWFLSKKARFTFSGYCFSQLKRIRTHRGYLLNPPTHKPTRAEFGLPETSTIDKEHRKSVVSIPDKWINPEAKVLVNAERAFESALTDWNAYSKWLTERNPYRRQLEIKMGFDGKHACHLVRLFRCGKEILRDGEVHVYRPDRDELRAILNGEWSYDKIEALVAESEAELEVLYKQSTLRDKPDRAAIQDLYLEICEEFYGIKLRGDV